MSAHVIAGDQVPEEIDLRRRRMLVTATAITGAVGLAIAAEPFIASWEPSQRAKSLGAPVEIDIAKVEPGAMLTVPWRGKPVWVVHRTPQMLSQIDDAKKFLLDPSSNGSLQPDFAKNESRAERPAFFVALGVCTHLGCTPQARFMAGDPGISKDWPGGFYCPCHGSKYDLAGRVFKDMPAPANLTVPPYQFIDEYRILIGSGEGHQT